MDNEKDVKSIQKPVSIIIAECKNSIVNVLNESSLSPCILEMIMKDLYMEISQIANQQLNNDNKKYIDAVNELHNKEPQE